MSIEDRVEALRGCEFLSDSAESVLRALADRAEVIRASAGQRILTQGELGSDMYCIIEGAVTVHDEQVELASLDAGEVFGEMAVLDSEVRSASVTAINDTLLLRIERETFFEALADDAESLQAILRAVIHRERAIVRDVELRTRKLQAYEKELEIGRQIQAEFLPNRIPDLPGWDIAARFEAAREVAGDFYDLFLLESGGRLALVIGDVCDKGVGAALYMTLFRSLIRASALFGYGAPALTPDAGDEAEAGGASAVLLNSLTTTNQYIANTHSDSSMFATLFLGILDPRTGALDYVNAGHEAPVIFRADGSRERLGLSGGVVGLFAGIPFRCQRARLESGDLLFAYSDGVNEAKSPSGEQFSDERILDRRVPDSAGAAKFLDTISGQIARFRGDAAQSDDITMIAIRSRVEAAKG